MIDRVPAGTTYILTVTGFPAGFAHRACRDLIRCRIRTIPSQGFDLGVQPAKDYGIGSA